jgi:RNA polymerase sigma-70 factor, ECF subfamily
MNSTSRQQITQMLVEWSNGDQAALDKIVPLIHSELHKLAHQYMRRERAGHTLQTTALVNEAYLRLVDQKNVQWQNRAHFFGIAAQMMRRILVDYARKQNYLKHGGGVRHVSLDQAAVISRERTAELVALDEALNALALIDPRAARVVELRFFGGLTVKETAEAMGLSVDMVKRDWSTAKAWLHRQMSNV